MPSITLDSFKDSFDDILRPNRFLFAIDDEQWDEDFGYMCKSCSLPGRTINDININWCGMTYHVPGDPSFNTITVTFLNDNKYSLRKYFEDWLNLISNETTNEKLSHNEVKSKLQIDQLKGDGTSICSYSLFYAHPTEISEIELDYDSSDAIETFTVTFSYSYFERTDFETEAINKPNNSASNTQAPLPTANIG